MTDWTLECPKCNSQFAFEEGADVELACRVGILCPECKERGYAMVGVIHPRKKVTGQMKQDFGPKPPDGGDYGRCQDCYGWLSRPICMAVIGQSGLTTVQKCLRCGRIAKEQEKK